MGNDAWHRFSVFHEHDRMYAPVVLPDESWSIAQLLEFARQRQLDVHPDATRSQIIEEVYARLGEEGRAQYRLGKAIYAVLEPSLDDQHTGTCVAVWAHRSDASSSLPCVPPKATTTDAAVNARATAALCELGQSDRVVDVFFIKDARAAEEFAARNDLFFTRVRVPFEVL